MAITKQIIEGKAHQPELEDFPDYDERRLAKRLRQSLNTLRAWRSRYPDRLPPGTKIGRVWLYNKIVVEQWLAAQGNRIPGPPMKMDDLPTLSRRGKPSKQETISARAMGLSVPVWRARQAGGTKK